MRVAGVLIAPTRGSNISSGRKSIRLLKVLIAPTRGSNRGIRSRGARRGSPHRPYEGQQRGGGARIHDAGTVLIAPTRGSNCGGPDTPPIQSVSSSPLRGAATRRAAPAHERLRRVLIAPTRGSNALDRWPMRSLERVLIAPTRGSNWAGSVVMLGPSVRSSSPLRGAATPLPGGLLRGLAVLIAPTRGSNDHHHSSAWRLITSSSPLRGAATWCRACGTR